MNRIYIVLIFFVLSSKSYVFASKDYEIQLQNSHSYMVSSIASDAKSTLMATGDSKGVIKIWNLENGFLLRELNSNFCEAINDLNFSFTGDTLVSASGKNIILWDVKNGSIIKRFSEHQFIVQSVSLNRHNNKLMSSGQDKELYIYDLADSTAKPFNITNELPFENSEYLSDGINYIIQDEKGIKILKTGINDLKGKYLFNDTIVKSFFITSKDYLAVKNKDNSLVIYSNIKEAQVLISKKDFKDEFSINSDASLLVTYNDNGKLTISNRHQTKTYFDLIDSNNYISYMRFSDDDKYLFLGYVNGALKVLEINYGNEANANIKVNIKYTFETKNKIHYGFLKSFNNLSYTVFTNTNKFIQLNTLTKVPVCESKTDIAGIMSSVKINDSIVLVSGLDGNYLSTINVKSKQVEKYGTFANSISKIRYDNNSGIVAVKENDRGISVFDYKDKHNINKIPINDEVSEISDFVILQDTNLLAVSNYDGIIFIYDYLNGNILNKINVSKSAIEKIDYDIRTKNIYFATSEGQVGFYNLKKENILYFKNQLTDKEKAFNSPIVDFILDDESTRIIVLGTDKKLKVLNLFDLSVISTHNLTENSSISNMDLNKKNVLSILNDDGRINCYRLGYGFEYIGMIQLEDDNEWVCIDKNGNFDGTPKAIKNVHYSKNREVYGLNSFYDKFKADNILVNILMDEVSKKSIDNEISKIPKIIKCDFEKNTIQVNVLGNGSKVIAITISSAGKLIDEFSNINKNQDIYSFEIPADSNLLKYDELVITAFTDETYESLPYVYNLKEIKESLGITYKSNENIKSKKYIITLAIDNYDDKTLKLNCAKSDANKISESLSAKFNSTNIVKINFSDSFTKLNTNKLFDSLSKVIQPEDKVILFIAGHGKQTNNRTGYEILLSDYNSNNNSSLNFDEIAKYLLNLKSENQLLILSACNSGTAQELLNDNYNETNMFGKLSRKAGFNLLTSSSSNSNTWEVKSLGLSIYTKVLIDAINLPTSKKLKDIRNYVKENLPSESVEVVNVPQFQFDRLNPYKEFIFE